MRTTKFLRHCLLAGVAIAALPTRSNAAEMIDGPFVAAVERVVDGDSLVVRVRIWIGQDVETIVRVRGIDAPELRGRCEGERAQARAARDFLAAHVEGREVMLIRVEPDKYGGRVLANVTEAGGGDLGELLVGAGLARRYDGGRRDGWC